MSNEFSGRAGGDGSKTVDLGTVSDISPDEVIDRPDVSREPTFVERGRASFKQYFKEARDYGAIRRTPYGLKPMLIFAIIGTVGRFDGIVTSVGLPEILRDLELNPFKLFAVNSLIGFLTTFVILLAAFYGDRVRRIPFVALGSMIGGAFSLVTTRTNTLAQFAWARSVDSVGNEIRTIPAQSLLGDYYPPEHRGKVFAFFGVTADVALFAGFLVVPLIMEKFGWRMVFYITGPLMIVAGAYALFGLKEPIRGYMERKALGYSEEEARKPEEAVTFGEAWRTIWSIRTLRRLFIANIPYGMANAIYIRAISIYWFQEYGLDARQRGYLAAGIGIVTLPFGLMAGGVVDSLLRRRPQRVLLLSGLLALFSTVIVLVLAVTPPLFFAVLVFVISGAAAALLGPARSVLFVQIVPAHMRTTGLAVQLVAGFPIAIFNFFIFSALANSELTSLFLAAAPLIAISAFIDISAAGLFERDVRAAIASQEASLEYRRAKESGRGKLLVCRDVDVEYDSIQVLFGVDFDVEEGDIIALLGTNGAGKSTLLKAIAGIQEASSGAIVCDGRDITHMPPHEIAPRGVILMPGGRGVFPNLTVKENLTLGNWMATDAKVASKGIDEVFQIFPVLKERQNAKAAILSGGEQQMLSLGQAFLAKPKLLMIDELSLGLSPAVVQQLIEIVKAIHQRGTTIILVEQSVNVALTVAERAIFMEKGEVKFVGRTEDLLRRPDILRAVYVKGTGGLTDAPISAQKSARELRSFELERSGSALEVRNLTKFFGGVKAVEDVSFGLREGEILGLIGPNGAGKTTVFDLIAGYQIPDSGHVVYHGVDVTNMGPDERGSRRLVRRFQDARLFPSLSVYENILVALDRRLDVRNIAITALQLPQARQAERRIRTRAHRIIELLDLGAYRDKFVKELSTGLRRITDLACVLAAEPKVLLLDEPSTGIAQAEAEMLGPLLRRIRFETGCSILIIEHDMPLISSISDELIAMDQGAIVLRGVPDDVLNDERVIQSYLGTSEEAIQRSGIRG